jgi:hypothetical protein
VLKLQFPWQLIVGYSVHIQGLKSIADYARSIARLSTMIPV